MAQYREQKRERGKNKQQQKKNTFKNTPNICLNWAEGNSKKKKKKNLLFFTLHQSTMTNILQPEVIHCWSTEKQFQKKNLNINPTICKQPMTFIVTCTEPVPKKNNNKKNTIPLKDFTEILKACKRLSMYGFHRRLCIETTNKGCTISNAHHFLSCCRQVHDWV